MIASAYHAVAFGSHLLITVVDDVPSLRYVAGLPRRRHPDAGELRRLQVMIVGIASSTQNEQKNCPWSCLSRPRHRPPPR